MSGGTIQGSRKRYLLSLPKAGHVLIFLLCRVPSLKEREFHLGPAFTSRTKKRKERKIRLVSIKLVPEIETFLSDSYKRFLLTGWSLRFQSSGASMAPFLFLITDAPQRRKQMWVPGDRVVAWELSFFHQLHSSFLLFLCGSWWRKGKKKALGRD